MTFSALSPGVLAQLQKVEDGRRIPLQCLDVELQLVLQRAVVLGARNGDKVHPKSPSIAQSDFSKFCRPGNVEYPQRPLHKCTSTPCDCSLEPTPFPMQRS
eukprot:703198-Amphidinium_carterae.1